MKEQVNTIRKNIKEEIHKKYGHKILYAKDCQILSESILKFTNRQLSVTTLKRFFGIVQSPFNPSKYTLDTLAIYLNFKNWQDFVNSFEYNKHIYSHLSSWDQLKSRTNYITDYSLKSIAAKTGQNIDQLPTRAFAIKRMESFLNSSKTVTAFIAPNGYGKSTLMYQLTEKFFIGDNARYPNDILLLVDGSIMVNMINMQTNITWLQNLINFDPQNSFSNYFRQNPGEIKGRFILIIDGLNEIFYQTEKLTHFAENLMDIVAGYENIDWFKLIITCRPDIWKIFVSIIQKKPGLKAKWFDVSFDDLANTTINVPQLNRKEIKKTLENRLSTQAFQHLYFHYPEISELISHPYFLNLYILHKDIDKIHTDIDLLNHFVFERVLSEPYTEEKSKIIDAIFHLSNYAKTLGPVKKSELKLDDDSNTAYKELINQNILYEYVIPGAYLSVKTFVKFSNNIILEFLLANKWLEENEFDLELIREIIRFYDNNKQLRCNLIKYIIKIAFKEEQTEILKNIYSIFSPNGTDALSIDMDGIDPETINVIGVELRKNKAIRDYLIPHFAKSKLGQLFYFENFFDMDSLTLHSGENIKYYLGNNPSIEAQIYGHYLKFVQSFFEKDYPQCNHEIGWLQQLILPWDASPMTAGFYDSAQVIFSSAVIHDFNDEQWKNIQNRSRMFYEEQIQPVTSMPMYEYLIVNALNYGDEFKKIESFIKMALKRYVLSDYSTAWMYQLFIAFYSRALLNLDKTEEAKELFQQVEFKNIPATYNYYVKLRYYLIRYEFLMHDENITEAKEILQEIKVVAKMIRYKYFYEKAQSLEDKLCEETQEKSHHKSHL